MTPQIKQRIDQIRRGEVPERYKKTKVGIVPEEWEESTLSEYLLVNNEKNGDLKYGKEDVFSISGDLGIVNQIDLLGRSYAGASVAPYGIVYPNDVVYTKSPLKANPYGIIKTNLTETVGIVSTLYAIFHCKNNVCPQFVQDYFSWDHRLNNYLFPIVNIGAKHDMKISDENSLKGVVVFPPLAEQEKIAEILQTQDKLIELQQKKIDELKRLKKVYLSKMFPKKGCNVPEVRFPEFTGAWEQRKLGEIAEIVGGGTPSTSIPEYWDGDIHWYAPAEMEGKRYADNSVRKITELGLKNSSAKVLPANKTVLFTSRAGIGKTAILRHPAATNQGFQSLVLYDEYNPYFIYSRSDEIKQKAEGVASGSTFLEISGKLLSNIEIALPCKDEQDAIAAFFERLDDLITLHQRKLDEEQKKKKALMQLLLTGIVRVNV